MSNIDGNTTFKITNTKSYVPIVTLSIKDNVKLTEQLNEEFKWPVYWNKYKTKIESKKLDNNNLTRFYQGVRRLFLHAFNNTTVDVANIPVNSNNNDDNNRVSWDSQRKYFLPRVNITNLNVLVNARNFYNQPINDQIKSYDKIRKIATGQGDDYTAGCLLDC